MVFGPRRADVFGTRADALVALKQVVDPKAKKKPALHSTALSVVPSPGGRSAWAVDIVETEGESLAVTAILSNADDIWLVNVAALARTPAMRTIRAELKQEAVVPPAMTGIAKVDASAQGAVDRFDKGLASQQLWGDDLASRSDAVVIGPGAGDVTRGKAEIKKLWKHRMKENVREVIAGDRTASATKDGQLAWVTAPVVRFADDDDPLPLRAFAVFEKNGSEWRMIALTESVALDVAGAGAVFKKTQPPKLEKKEEPPP
ncbi:MAG: nuclear transport factor 2 family protein, partial [Acidobacteriota bacterium]